MSTVLMINAEWNLTGATLSVEVSNFQTPANTFGVLIKKLHYYVKLKRDPLWMEQLAAETRLILEVYGFSGINDFQWCVNGRCESTSKNIARADSLKHNGQAGGWSSWSRWGPCSRTCGGGVTFRTRRCNNPKPSYGGEPCRGKSEEYKLCNIYRYSFSQNDKIFSCSSYLLGVSIGKTSELSSVRMNSL